MKKVISLLSTFTVLITSAQTILPRYEAGLETYSVTTTSCGDTLEVYTVDTILLGKIPITVSNTVLPQKIYGDILLKCTSGSAFVKGYMDMATIPPKFPELVTLGDYQGFLYVAMGKYDFTGDKTSVSVILKDGEVAAIRNATPSESLLLNGALPMNFNLDTTQNIVYWYNNDPWGSSVLYYLDITSGGEMKTVEPLAGWLMRPHEFYWTDSSVMYLAQRDTLLGGLVVEENIIQEYNFLYDRYRKVWSSLTLPLSLTDSNFLGPRINHAHINSFQWLDASHILVSARSINASFIVNVINGDFVTAQDHYEMPFQTYAQHMARRVEEYFSIYDNGGNQFLSLTSPRAIIYSTETQAMWEYSDSTILSAPALGGVEYFPGDGLVGVSWGFTPQKMYSVVIEDTKQEAFSLKSSDGFFAYRVYKHQGNPFDGLEYSYKVFWNQDAGIIVSESKPDLDDLYGYHEPSGFWVKLKDIVSLDKVLSEEESFAIYPNPIQRGQSITANQLIKEISLINQLGQEVLNKKVGDTKFLVDLPPGIYFTRINDLFIKKLVIY